MDQVPVAQRPEPTLPRLTLLVGRVTTIKLAYWSALTVLEVGLGLWMAPFDERFRVSIGFGVALTLAACAWAAQSARAADARAGGLVRSIPTVATTFIVASVVASPASLPLLIVERQRSLEGCFPAVCHWEAIWWWIAAIVVGTVLIPLVFAVRMEGPRRTRP